MDSRERLTRCFDHLETDRPGVYSREGFPHGDASYDALKALLREKTDLRPLWWGPTVMRGERPVRTYTEPHSRDLDRRVSVLETPQGPLTATWLVARDGSAARHETYYIKSPEDALKYLSLPEPQALGEPEGFFELIERVGSRGIVDVNMGMNAAGKVAELCGSEMFAIFSITDRDMLHRLMEREFKAMERCLDKLLSIGVGRFFSMLGQEYITPPLHGEADFRDFNVRYDKPLIDRIHESGGRVHVHCHGSVRSVLDAFLDMGVDVLHPIEAPPMGDISIGEAKARVRGRITIEGNIQIADMYEKTPEQVARQTRDLIRIAWDDRKGLIVSPTASPYIPGGGQSCFAQYAAMIEEVLAAG